MKDEVVRRNESPTHKSDHGPLQCVLRLPLPDAEAASIAIQVLRVEPPVPGTMKEVQLWTDDSTRSTLHIRLCAVQERSMRAAVGALLEQVKLVLRTMDAFPAVARRH
ncbi:putative Transcription factor Pcc1 [Trypanosoma vivax]|uniref:Transcription factor Pcc1 n=1 Tax=Trypanosoma vivax (strain Y486) TaxID=1055687 RepID=G0TUN5_TRYVY|nr:hypothetical protein TRVL_10149 [Trypanosoma vivax]KAH8607327.1 putative Transcription factor Pcc1 [Trypanosoma vivax]CCC47670.1 conserved hypothetical protein [Trypanosoma vivax Y486]